MEATGEPEWMENTKRRFQTPSICARGLASVPGLWGQAWAPGKRRYVFPMDHRVDLTIFP